MPKWSYLIESDVRLRRLKRAASGNLSALKRYMRELVKLDPREALNELIDDYRILPGISVDIDIHEETDMDPEGNFSDDRDAAWARKELDAGNEYAWCSAHVRVEWFNRYGSDHLGAISAEDRKGVLETIKDHDMVQGAAQDLVTNKLRNKPLAVTEDVVNPKHYVHIFLNGHEQEDWVIY